VARALAGDAVAFGLGMLLDGASSAPGVAGRIARRVRSHLQGSAPAAAADGTVIDADVSDDGTTVQVRLPRKRKPKQKGKGKI